MIENQHFDILEYFFFHFISYLTIAKGTQKTATTCGMESECEQYQSLVQCDFIDQIQTRSASSALSNIGPNAAGEKANLLEKTSFHFHVSVIC
jgi:hypothetical protein